MTNEINGQWFSGLTQVGPIEGRTAIFRISVQAEKRFPA